MAGTDTVRGIAYQQAQAVLLALDLLGDDRIAAIRVEGDADVIDVELLDESGDIQLGKQIKTRSATYTWGRKDLLTVLRRWGELRPAPFATFEFLTDGRLGPTGEKVKAALWDAAHGDRSAIAELLAVDAESTLCHAASRATIRIDPSGTAALLSRAERQLAGMLPPARTRQDNLDLARQGVDALFRLLIDRAGRPDPAARVVSRTEVAESAGVPLELSTLRWEADYVNRVLAAVKAADLEGLVPVRVVPLDGTRAGVATSDEQPLARVLEHRVAIVTGRTGSGKSTAALLLSRAGAEAERPVLVAHAEAYLANHLNALAADAIGAVLDEPVSSAVGREALADESVTFLIDGVSEIPEPLREALAVDLLAWTVPRRACQLVLVGRDVAGVRSTLPSSATPALFSVAAFGREAQLELAEGSLTDAAAHLEKVRGVLGDGTENPLLLSMALSVSGEGLEFDGRASLYERFLGLLAARSGTQRIDLLATVLGVVFAGLLDEGRRFADAFDWRTRLVRAIDVVASAAGPVSATEVERASAKAGLVVPIDFTETVVPIHDSFADYLAGRAHARGLVAFPERLAAADEQRLLFAAEYAGLDSQTARRVVTDLPYVAARLAPYDRRPLARSNLEEVGRLLGALLPEDVALPGVAAWEVGDGRTVVMTHHRTEWLDRDAALEVMATGRSVVLEDPSTLATSVELWRDWLKETLVVRPSAGAPRPLSQDEAVAALRSHADAVAASLRVLVPRIAPVGGQVALRAEIGPPGMEAEVHPMEQTYRVPDWPVSYHDAEQVDVRPAAAKPGGLPAAGEFRARSSVEFLTHRNPECTAVQRIRVALERLTLPQWLG